jgi:D-hydroxyproline dehydrogenase subunit alpha
MTKVEQIDIAIIGGGPAGMAAAIEARRAGVRSVCVFDEWPTLGGQIFRRFGPGFFVFDALAAGHEYRDGQKLIDEVHSCGAQIRSNTIVWGIWDKRLAYVTDSSRSELVDGKAIIVATGGRDRSIPFPGWTLPGVITAGAAKTLVAIQRVLPGERILMAGSGPLALAFSAQLKEYGANIVEVAEAASNPSPTMLAKLFLYGPPAVISDAIRYRLRLIREGIPYSPSTIIARAEGNERVERAQVAKVDSNWRVIAGTERTIEVDTILLGYGLESSSELTRLIGCTHKFDSELGGWIPVKDSSMRTSKAGIFAAGDGSGIGGVRFALEEGRIAGVMAACSLGVIDSALAAARIAQSKARLRKWSEFRRVLNEIYREGPGACELAHANTVICRCEERTHADLETLVNEGVRDANIVRAQSRIGMGRCQGRNCYRHVAATIARKYHLPLAEVQPLSVRPPIKPISLAAIAVRRDQPEAEVIFE